MDRNAGCGDYYRRVRGTQEAIGAYRHRYRRVDVLTLILDCVLNEAVPL